MPPASTGSFANHLAVGIHAIIGTDLKDRGSRAYYTQILKEEKGPPRNYFDFLAAAGLPIAVRKLEADPITSVDPLEGSTKRVTYEEWALGFEVTQTAWEDDQYAGKGSALRAAANGLSTSLMERREIEAHRPFNAEGFTTAFPVLPDATAFIATAHAPVTGGEAGSQANRPTTDVALSVTSFRSALSSFKRVVNDRGLRIPDYIDPVALIVPPELEYTALELVRSASRPDTSANVENVTRNAVKIIVDPYITDTNMWFIQARKHFAYFFRRTPARFDNFDDRRRRIAVFVAWERYKALPIHWLGHYGVNPA